MNETSMSLPDTASPRAAPRFGSSEFVALVSAAVCLLYAGHIIFTDAFGDASRYSNRSLAGPAIGLALVVVTYCVARFRSPRLWVRIVAWPFAVFACYLAFGAALLVISLFVRAVT
ncbi:MAG: hypothetical protein J0L73_13105 [Verrucomicrobia bacterium]|nr:hypothetical protein [Verrucomicrobiota bacterium]